MKLLRWLVRLTECQHGNTSFPQTDKRTREVYVCCLTCGKEIPYDWKNLGRVA